MTQSRTGGMPRDRRSTLFVAASANILRVRPVRMAVAFQDGSTMRTRLIGTVLALALLIGLPPARSGAGGQTGELGAAIPAQPLPIVDLHFHAEDGWDRDALVQRFDQLGVARAGNGAEGADSLALE